VIASPLLPSCITRFSLMSDTARLGHEDPGDITASHMLTPPCDNQHEVDSRLVPGGPTISVVTAVRDYERTIQRAIRSALNQTSPANEVIVVDDISEDATKERILELMCDRLVVLDGEGRGAAAARNAGIRKASGTWIAFLDGDDYWEPNFLELARQRICSSPDAVACFGAVTHVDESGCVLRRGKMPQIVTLEEFVAGRIPCNTSATLARRDALNACGGFFEGLTRAVEDHDLWWRLAAFDSCIGFPQAAALHEIHEERNRSRSVDVLATIQQDHEMLVDRLATRGAPLALIRRGRAITRARISRHWLNAEKSAHARAQAWSSLRTLPTRDGLVALVLASMPQTLGKAIIRLVRRYRVGGLDGGESPTGAAS
jgi:glycosyltransferase involved in cell wall biosynthesis